MILISILGLKIKSSNLKISRKQLLEEIIKDPSERMKDKDMLIRKNSNEKIGGMSKDLYRLHTSEECPCIEHNRHDELVYTVPCRPL